MRSESQLLVFSRSKLKETNLNVHPHETLLVRLMSGIQPTQHLGRIQSSVLGQRPRDHLQRIGEPFDGMLRQSRGLLSKLGNALGELQLGSSRSGNQTRILDDALDDVDSVVDGALDVVHLIGGGSPDDDSGGPGSLLSLTEDGNAVSTNLDSLNDVALSHLVDGGRSETGERGGTDDTAEAAEVKLGEDLDDEDAVAVEVVEGELADGGTGDEDVETRVGNLLEDLERANEGELGEERRRAINAPSPCASPLRARS